MTGHGGDGGNGGTGAVPGRGGSGGLSITITGSSTPGNGGIGGSPVLSPVTGAASVLNPTVKNTGTQPNTAVTPAQKNVTGSVVGGGTHKAGTSH